MHLQGRPHPLGKGRAINQIMKVAIAILAAVLGGTNARQATSALGEKQAEEAIVVREYSLVTENGVQVMHKNFDHRRLQADGFDNLHLAFHAKNTKVCTFLYIV